jgi:2-isopropylmalate synthase
MERKILVLDTTLRDGEQVPGAKLNLAEKIEIGRQLSLLNVDYIEAGFSSSSAGDFSAVQAIAREVGKGDGPVITALARAVKSDIDAVYESVRDAERPMIHIVLGTSGVHLTKKFKKSPEQVMQMGVDAVAYAKTLLPEVQYSPEDATRSDFEYLWKTIEAVVNAGATVINIADTVGYAVPEQFGDLFRRVHERLMNLNDKVILSVHCHNDTGLATANTLAAVKNGANKVECTVNGIGERAGNAALEEVVMGIRVRKDYYGAETGINTQEIRRTSRLVSALMGLDVQVNKAITGDNAFAHSSGIHQDGLLKSADVYEIILPADVGVEGMELVLTARSGKHALQNAIEKLGFTVKDDTELQALHTRFLALADKKKEVYDDDLYYLLKGYMEETTGEGQAPVSLCHFVDFQVVSNTLYPTAVVKIRKGDDIIVESAIGDGPIDAIYGALSKATGLEVELLEYKINSVSQGAKALGRATIQIGYGGKSYYARAIDTDIIKASAVAYINGINKILLEQA